MDEHVPAPDPVGAAIVEREQLHRRLDDLDVALEPAVGDRLLRELDVKRQRIERVNAQAVLADEPDRVLGVAAADVEENITFARTE